MSGNVFDLIIIGGGPAGLTAAMYASRSRVNTLLLERMGCGGQAAITDWLENYPGFVDGTSGFELADKIKEQALKFGAKILFEDVTDIIPPADKHKEFTVKTSVNAYKALSLIIASGAQHKTLGIPGESEFLGRGVSYCATCDGPFFRNKDVVVVGGGDSAIQEAIYLTRFASKVSIIHRRDRLRATKILQERAKSNEKISFIWNSIPVKLDGKESLTEVTVKNVHTNGETKIKADGFFVFVGLIPNSALFKNIVKMDEYGYIFTDNNMHTSHFGIFACGDVRIKNLRQVVTACGDGAAAAFASQEYIDEIKGTSY